MTQDSKTVTTFGIRPPTEDAGPDSYHSRIPPTKDLNPRSGTERRASGHQGSAITVAGAKDLNPTQRITIRFRSRVEGAHTHVRVFAGRNPGSLGKCGDLVFRNEEYTAFVRESRRGKFGPSDIEYLEDTEESAPITLVDVMERAKVEGIAKIEDGEVNELGDPVGLTEEQQAAEDRRNGGDR